MPTKQQAQYWIILIMIIGGAIVFAPAIAQDSDQIIRYDDLALGEINLSQIEASYQFDGSSGDTVYLRTQALSPDFALVYRLFDSDGELLATGTNANGQPGSLSIVDLPTSDTYKIQIQSANSQAGQYSISIEEGATVEIPSLPIGEIVYADVDYSIPDTYIFETTTDGSTFLMLKSMASNNDITINIVDTNSDETVALFRPEVSGLCMRMAPQSANYQMSISLSQNESENQDYQVMVWRSESANLSCPSDIFDYQSTDAIITPIMNMNSNVAVVPASTFGINMRAAPTTSSPVISVLNPGEDITILGISEDAEWLMADFDGTVVWVSSEVVESVGDMDQLPQVDVSGILSGYDMVDEETYSNDISSTVSNNDVTNTVADTAGDGNNNIDNITATGNEIVETNVNNQNINLPVIDLNSSNDSNSNDAGGNDISDTVKEVEKTVNNVVGGVLGGN